MARGGITLSIGQLLDAAERDACAMRGQPQTKIAQAASPPDGVDILSTPSVMALAQAGRKLASRMKVAEDDMEGASGVNTGSAPSGMKDSLTPSGETPRQFYVDPSGKTDVSPSDNRFSIPNQTEQKSTAPSMNPGVSMPGQFLAPKIGASQKAAQEETGVMDFTGGGPVRGSPAGLSPRAPITPEARSAGTTEGREAVERKMEEKTQSLDPIRAVHERYSRAAAALAKHAQPGGEAQPTTATGPMVGPGKPEAHSPSSDTTSGDKPPTSYEGVSETSRQDADAKALADAASQTDLPLAAAKETTEGVLDEVLKAASFRQFYNTLDPNSKIASLLRNRLLQKHSQGDVLQSGDAVPPMVIQGRLPGTMNFEGGGGVGGSPVGLPSRFVPEGPPLRTAVEAGQEAVGNAVNQTTGGPSMAPPVVVPPAAKVPGAQGGLKGMTDEMNQAWNPYSPQGQGL